MKWYWIVAIVLAVVVVLVSRRGESGIQKPQLPYVRPGATGTDADVDAYIRAGQKINAIKIYRGIHKVGLKDAKDAVDARARELANPGATTGE